MTELYCDFNQLTSLDVSNNTALTTLFCNSNQLTGLDVTANTALQILLCDNNKLISLDVMENTQLNFLNCFSNQLTSLDVSNNTALTVLRCYDNQLTGLDVSNNTALEFLYCYDNQLTGSLDLSNNSFLTELACFGNQLIGLDVRNGNNTILEYLNSTNNPDLTCIYVEDVSYTTNWEKDPASTFVTDEAECTAVLSIEDNTFELGVSIYPNPTDRYLFIEGNVNPLSISIYNLLGKKVLSAKNTNKVDVKELSSGVYMIKITDGVSQTNRKFIKN